MKTKVLASALLLVGGASSSYAADIDWGTDPVSASAFVSVAKGLFLDTYLFTLSTLSDVSSSAVSVPLPGKAITFGTYSLWSAGADAAVDGGDDMALGSWGFTTVAAANVSTLAAGTYYFAVQGKGTGTTGGKYLLGADVTPVPEPETLAMMLAGLGAVGFLARRRQSV